MKRGEKYIVQVAPELDVRVAQGWIKNLNVLLKSTMIYSLNLKMSSALNVMMDLVSDIVPYDRALFYLLDDDEKQYHPSLVRGFEETFPPQLSLGNIVLDWTVENHQPVRINNPDTKTLEELAYYTGCRSAVSIPISHDNRVKGILQIFKTEANRFSDENVRMLWILALQMEGMFHRLFKARDPSGLEKDPFTDLPRRAVFEQELEKELIRSRRNSNPFSVLLVDIDGFKELKVAVMSLEGDIMVREVSSLIGKVIRRIDIMARYSESCIGLILPDADAQKASVFANRIKTMVSANKMKGIAGHASLGLTVSVGVSTFPGSVTQLELLQGAEEAARRARAQGGNAVEKHLGTLARAQGDPVAIQIQELLSSMGRFFNLDALLEQLVYFYSRAARAGRVSILVLNDNGAALRFIQGTGFHGFEEDIRAMSLPLKNSISGSVVRTKRPLLIQDIERTIPKRPRGKLNYTSPSFMSVPLIHGDNVVGVMNLSNPVNGEAFEKEDLDHILPMAQGVAELIAEGKRFTKAQEGFFSHTADVLLGVAEEKSPYLSGHSDRVAQFSLGLAKKMGYSAGDAEVLARSAKFHDLGRIAIDEALLSKAGDLEEDEREQVKAHPIWSYRILESIPGMDVDLEAVKAHHERYDGKGYPDGLLGEEIPMGARIMAVADCYDALTSDRPYRPAMKHEEALKIMDNNNWSQFDGRVVKAFKAMDIEH